MEFMDRNVESAKETVDRLKSSPIDSQEFIVELSSMLVRTNALKVLDLWLEIVGEHIEESENVKAFYQELYKMRFEELDDKKITGIENVFGENNKLLYSGFDLREAVKVKVKHQKEHPSIRIEHWVNGVYKYTHEVQ